MDERGNIDFVKEKGTFNDAIEYARSVYVEQKAYYQGIINDCASIKKKKK